MQQYYFKRQPQGETKLSRRSLARMEAFLDSCAMALPDDTDLPFTRGDGVVKKKQTTAIGLEILTKAFAVTNNKQTNSSTVQKKMKKNRNNHFPQIHMDDLILRLELYIRNIRRIHALREQQLVQQQKEQHDHQYSEHEQVECVLNFDPPRVIHARIQILLNSLIATTNSVVSMRPILTKLLTYLTRELLAVEHLSEELNGYIRKIVLEYEHLTSFASLAFLSSPRDSAETHLSSLLLKYFDFLRSEWEMCIDKCKLESTLARAIDPGMREVFKNSEFISIGHLLDVCQEYQRHLENIVILPRDSDSYGIGSSFYFGGDDAASSLPVDVIASAIHGDLAKVKKCQPIVTKTIKQALRDLRRERITVNGHMLPPAQSLTELVKLLRERLHTRTVKLRDKKVAYARNDKNEKGEPLSSDDQQESDSGDNDIISSGNEGDIDGSSAPCIKRQLQYQHESVDDEDDSTPKDEPNGGTKVKRRNFNVNAIDIMTRRLLIAASRTASGGDALFVV